MSDEYEELFEDDKYVCQMIGEARKAFGSRETTPEQYDQMQKMLGIMYLNCNENMMDIVMSTIKEADTRRFYYETGIWLTTN